MKSAHLNDKNIAAAIIAMGADEDDVEYVLMYDIAFFRTPFIGGDDAGSIEDAAFSE